MSDRRFPFLNRVTISGIVTRKPSLRTNKSGVATLKLSLAVSLPTLSDDKSRKRFSTIRISVFVVGDLAISCDSMLVNGSEMIVEGRLSSPPSHGSVSRLEVHAERLQLVDSEGALQFLERDILELGKGQTQDQAQGKPDDSVSDSVSGSASASVSAKGTSVSDKPVQLTSAKRSASSRSQAKKVVSKSTTSDVAKSESKPTRSRRKPVDRSVDKSASAPAIEKAKPRRRRPAVQTKSAPVKQEVNVVSNKTVSNKTVSSEVTAAVSSSPEKRKPAPSRRKRTSDSDANKRPRNVPKSSKAGSEKAVDNKQDKNITKNIKKAAKPKSNSPFELVETEDSFDPFLLED